MSSSEAQLLGLAAIGHRLRPALCATLLAVALAACGSEAGFRPLHGPLPGGIGLDQKMAQVKIAPIPSRVGQRVRNELIFQNTGGGTPPPPTYMLEVVIRESLSSALVQTTGEALSQIYNLNAEFRLITLSDKKVVLTGSAQSRAGFERFTSIYSNVRAREDAENRAAKTIAGELKGRLAAFLSRARA